MTTITKKKLGSGELKYVKYSEAKAGDCLAVGEFLGTQMVRAYDPTQPDVPQHKVKTDEGVVALNSAGQLNHILKDVIPGTVIEVVFLGKEKVKTKAGKVVSTNQFEVFELQAAGA